MSARNRYFEDERLETVDPRTLRRLMGYLKPYKLQVILALFLMAVARLADLLNPILIMIAIDKYIANGNLKGLINVALVYLLLLAISNIAIRFRVLVTNKTGHNMIKNIRKEVFSHIQKLSFNFFDSLRSEERRVGKECRSGW